MIQEWFDNHATYVLVGRSQFHVLLDDQNDPSEMWSSILFSLGDTMHTEGPSYRIIDRLDIGMNLRKYKLEKV